MEADDWAAVYEIHLLECQKEELENENDSLRDELFHSNNMICDLVEREAYRDEVAARRGWRRD